MLWTLWSTAPAIVIRTLRACRSAGLRIASPFETAADLEAPPLWLRRHTGKISNIESAAAATIRLVREYTVVRPGDAVLDAGCGFGVMARPLAECFGTEGRYVGLDRDGASIRWAQKNIAASDPRFRFVLGSTSSRFPAGDEDIGFVLAKSLFTHLKEIDARRALGEIARVLTRGRSALITAFLFEEDSPPEKVFPFADAARSIRWRLKFRPEAAIAYERVHFSRMVTANGLRIDTFRPGFWPGSDHLKAQDVLVLSKE
ncbi:MAG: class I SAM-dependent methyltransferase [Acidobacteriota bacterium]